MRAPSFAIPAMSCELAVDVFERIQSLRNLNGLAENSPPALPPEQATPGHVVAVLEAAATDLAELAPVYGIGFDTALPLREENRGPQDVLAHLRAVNASLERLGVPPVLPNDVYSTALSLDEQMMKTAQLRGVSADIEAPQVSEALPKDALAEALAFIDDLARLSADRPDLALAHRRRTRRRRARWRHEGSVLA